NFDALPEGGVKWGKVAKNGKQARARGHVFRGHSTPALDSKNRVTIQACWRRMAPDEFWVLPSFNEPCLWLLSEEAFDELNEKISTREGLNESARQNLRRHLNYRAMCSPMDKQGRVVLPAEYVEKFSFEKEVVLVGGGNRIEAWRPGDWSSLVETNEEAVAGQMADVLGL
ncbi:MAG: hypothetical protein AAF514_13490, partial [Verrucomicrobiota bacterium]